MAEIITRANSITKPGEADDVKAGWTALPTPGAAKTQGFLSEFSSLFNENVVIKKGILDAALKKVNEDASDPEALAKYQAALGEYTLYRNAQSNAVKAYKDVDGNTIRNFN